MAKSSYKIAVVERGYELLWREFWQGKPSKEAKQAHLDGKLGQVRMIDASNEREAIRIAQQQNPGMTVMTGGTGRFGAK